LVFQPIPDLGIALFQLPHQAVHQAVYAHFTLVKSFNEEISNLRHQTGETEKCVGFSIFYSKKQKKCPDYGIRSRFLSVI
jgi:hypothetical protein